MSGWGIASEIWSWLQSASTVALLALATKLYLDRRRLKQLEKGGDWTRLRAEIDRLDERCDHLQSEVDECRRREGEWMARAIAAESALYSQGEVRQAAANAAAEVRLDALDKRKSGDGKADG